MSNKPEDDKAKAARGAPNIQPTFPPPIRPLEALKPATEPPESPLVLQMPMWLGTGGLVNTSGFEVYTNFPAHAAPESVTPTILKPSGSMTFTVQKGANTIPASILSAVTALFRPGSQQDPDTKPRKAG
jgi:hypothetical protein